MSENGFLELTLFFSYFLPGKTICFLSLKLDQLLHLTLLICPEHMSISYWSRQKLGPYDFYNRF